MSVLENMLFFLGCIQIAEWIVKLQQWTCRPRPLFRCDGCGRDIYPPAYKRLHVGKSTYCAECKATYWIKAAEAVRERNR